MKEKLYYYKCDIVFVSTPTNIVKNATQFFTEELRNRTLIIGDDIMEISELEDLTDLKVNKAWLDMSTLIWGTEDDMNVYQFFEAQQESAEEYQQYLKLKEKYENTNRV